MQAASHQETCTPQPLGSNLPLHDRQQVIKLCGMFFIDFEPLENPFTEPRGRCADTSMRTCVLVC